MDRGVKEGRSFPDQDIISTADLLIDTQMRQSGLPGERVRSALETDAPTKVLRAMGEKAVQAPRTRRISGSLEPESHPKSVDLGAIPPGLRKSEGAPDLSEQAVREHIKRLYG